MAVHPPPNTPIMAGLPPTILPGVAAVPDWVKLGAALLVLGFVAEMVYKASPGAAYLFVLLLLLGYAAAGEQYRSVTGLLSQLTGRGPVAASA